jgi:hypothetical protein
MAVSSDAQEVDRLSIEELKREAHDSYLEATAGGTLHYSLWATLRAGRLLLALKKRCKHGEFAAIKEAEGFHSMKASRFMRLAESPELTQCVNYADCQQAVDRHEWRSMRHVMEAHNLVSPANISQKVSTPVADLEVEDVELCRYSGGYLVRVSAGTDPKICAQRVEFAAETKDPAIARKVRDAVYRAFDAVGILPDRSRSKWESYKAQEPQEEPIQQEGQLAAIVARLKEYNLEEEFADLLCS